MQFDGMTMTIMFLENPAGCLPGDLVVCVQLMEDIMIGKHDVVLWGVVMGQATASFETRMGHASIAKVDEAS